MLHGQLIVSYNNTSVVIRLHTTVVIRLRSKSHRNHTAKQELSLRHFQSERAMDKTHFEAFMFLHGQGSVWLRVLSQLYEAGQRKTGRGGEGGMNEKGGR